MKAPRRTKEFELSGDYKGFKFEALVSIPMYVFSYLQTGNWSLIQSALKAILISWNFTDDEGNPIPQPQEEVKALDPFGEPVYLTETDKDGNDIQKPILVSGVSFISPQLGMRIIQKVSEDVMALPDPQSGGS